MNKTVLQFCSSAHSPPVAAQEVISNQVRPILPERQLYELRSWQSLQRTAKLSERLPQWLRLGPPVIPAASPPPVVTLAVGAHEEFGSVPPELHIASFVIAGVIAAIAYSVDWSHVF